MADLLFARRASERFWNLQRQGRITTVAPLTGQEAAVVGVVRALDLAHRLARALLPRRHRHRRARRRVPRAARRATGAAIPTAAASPTACAASRSQISLGTQVPHAAGLAWGLKLRGEPGVVCTFIGDGATSEGDFYEALNLAGVQRVPLLVVCINNGWAISTPTDAPDRGATRSRPRPTPPASRACGSTATTCSRWSTRRAPRAGGRRPATGPTLLELVTYRMGAHTNSDDPTRYVPDDELRDVAASATRSSGSARELERAGRLGRRTPRRRSSTRSKRGSSASSTPRSARGRPDDRARPRHRDADPRHGGAACRARAPSGAGIASRSTSRTTTGTSRGEHDHARGDPRDDPRRDGARRARHPARRGRRRATAACSAPPTACSTGSAPPGVRHADRGVGDRRRERRALGRRPRARWPRSSSAASACRRTTRSSASWRACGTAAAAGSTARSPCAPPYGGGVRTPEHHADSVEAPYTHTPGLKVVVPSNAADAKGLLASAVRDPDPVLFFEPIPCYRTAGRGARR